LVVAVQDEQVKTLQVRMEVILFFQLLPQPVVAEEEPETGLSAALLAGQAGAQPELQERAGLEPQVKDLLVGRMVGYSPPHVGVAVLVR